MDMDYDNTRYDPSDAVLTHPFWEKSLYWSVRRGMGLTVGDLRLYLDDYEDTLRRGTNVSYKAFLVALRLDLDRIDGRRP